MNKNLIWFVPAIVVALGIFALSTFLAFPIQLEDVDNLDKWEHTFAYFALSFSFLLAFLKSDGYNRNVSLQVLLVTAVYGLLLEFVQYQFFSYRFFEWADAIANVLGAFMGYLLFLLIKGKLGG